MTEKMTLVVEKSSIRSGGRARINEEELKELDIENGDQAVISSEHKDILLKVYGDSLVEKDKIILRSKDLEKLKVGEYDEVTVRKHRKLLNKLL